MEDEDEEDEFVDIEDEETPLAPGQGGASKPSILGTVAGATVGLGAIAAGVVVAGKKFFVFGKKSKKDNEE